jgi:hypothetical protein
MPCLGSPAARGDTIDPDAEADKEQKALEGITRSLRAAGSVSRSERLGAALSVVDELGSIDGDEHPESSMRALVEEVEDWLDREQDVWIRRVNRRWRS